jgi:hypothetical protein
MNARGTFWVFLSYCVLVEASAEKTGVIQTESHQSVCPYESAHVIEDYYRPRNQKISWSDMVRKRSSPLEKESNSNNKLTLLSK